MLRYSMICVVTSPLYLRDTTYSTEVAKKAILKVISSVPKSFVCFINAIAMHQKQTFLGGSRFPFKKVFNNIDHRS